MKFRNFVGAVKELGAVWLVISEVPPGSLRRSTSVGC